MDVQETESRSTDENIRYVKGERDQLAEDLQNVERSFSELHKRYDVLRQNSDALKKANQLLREELTDKVQQVQDSVNKFNVYADAAILSVIRARHS